MTSRTATGLSPATSFRIVPSAALVALSACTATTSGGAVGATRPQLLLVSSGQVEQIAAQSHTKLVSEATTGGVLNKNPATVKRMRAIAPQTAVLRADAPAWKWEINVLDSPQLNALYLPGGKIVFYTGLIEQLKLRGV